ncbi:MAG: response regulator [Syntrophobacteraceae bacterium]
MTDKSAGGETEAPARVLVADDDDIFLEILAEAVQDAGGEATLVPDGQAALDQLARARFDILITDLNMPRVDGLALLRQVRALHPHVLGILITGFGSLESAIEALRLGVYDYIQKPFMVEQIAVTIRNAIERVSIFKERSVLLEKIENLHKKLCLVEGKRYPEHEIYDISGQSISGPFFLDGKSRPETFLEKPKGDPTRALATLDTLRGLRREGVISETELERLKLAILKRIESGGS